MASNHDFSKFESQIEWLSEIDDEIRWKTSPIPLDTKVKVSLEEEQVGTLKDFHWVIGLGNAYKVEVDGKLLEGISPVQVSTYEEPEKVDEAAEHAKVTKIKAAELEKDLRELFNKFPPALKELEGLKEGKDGKVPHLTDLVSRLGGKSFSGAAHHFFG